MISRRFRTFIQLPYDVKLLFFFAVLVSAVSRFALSFVPFKKIRPYLGTPGVESVVDSNIEHTAYLKKLKTALTLCKKYTPWKTECYTMALTGKIILNRKKLISTIYIGFRKDVTNEYEGHAWLRCGTIILTGNNNIASYQVQSFFT